VSVEAQPSIFLTVLVTSASDFEKNCVAGEGGYSKQERLKFVLCLCVKHLHEVGYPFDNLVSYKC
jgi:hypothetical protein